MSRLNLSDKPTSSLDTRLARRILGMNPVLGLTSASALVMFMVMTLAILLVAGPAQAQKADGAAHAGCVKPSPEGECPLPPKKPVQKAAAVVREPAVKPRKVKAKPRPAPAPVAQPEAPRYVETIQPSPAVTTSGASEKNIITINQGLWGQGEEKRRAGAEEAARYYRTKAREFKAAYERERLAHQAANAKIAQLQAQLNAIKDQHVRDEVSYSLVETRRNHHDRSSCGCCQKARSCGVEACSSECCPDECSQGEGGEGFYLGLVGGFGPNGLSYDSRIEPSFSVVNQQYAPFLGLRLMGVSRSGYAVGAEILSNASLAIDLDIKIH